MSYIYIILLKPRHIKAEPPFMSISASDKNLLYYKDMIFDCVILGAGASGLMCASKLADKKTIIIEGNGKPGLKLLASGGGLCNFYNAELSRENYYSQNPRFCLSALNCFRFDEFKRLLKENGVGITLREDGKFFASSSKAVLDALLKTLGGNVEISFNTPFKKAIKTEDGLFEVSAGRSVFKSRSLVCALGGLSHKDMGASRAALDLAESFGHDIIPPYPALCGIVFSGGLKKRFQDTAGISLEAEVSCGKNKFLGGLLFTHQGLSGPALFNLSLYGIKNKTVTINFCPSIDVRDFIIQNRNGGRKLSSLLERILPARLVKALLNGFNKNIADLTKKEILESAALLNRFSFKAEELTGYEKAEISAGGIATQGISSKTMMSQKIPRLYFIGECLDVSGQLGGYNLAWAWASACAAAKAINGA